MDTGLLVRYLRGRKAAVQLLRGLSKRDRLCVATITRLELMAGAHPSEHFGTQKLLSRFATLELDRRVADRAGELVYLGRKANRPILVPDAILAATALVHTMSLVTLNRKDFESVAGLGIHPGSS